MSVENGISSQVASLAQIFQKAYARAVAMQRLDEQIGALLEQRTRLESEFRDSQAEVNRECERMLKSAAIAPAKLLAKLSAGTPDTADAIPLTTEDETNDRFGATSSLSMR